MLTSWLMLYCTSFLLTIRFRSTLDRSAAVGQPAHPGWGGPAGKDSARQGIQITAAGVDAVVREQVDARCARFAHLRDLPGDVVRLESPGANARVDMPVACYGNGPASLLQDPLRALRVGHQSDSVQNARLKPSAPVLSPVVEGVVGIGKDRRRHLHPGLLRRSEEHTSELQSRGHL